MTILNNGYEEHNCIEHRSSVSDYSMRVLPANRWKDSVKKIKGICSSSTVNLVSSLFIVFGLPIGFYLVFVTLNPIDQLKYASYEIGEEFIRGMQRGINETALNELVKKLTNTIIAGLNVNQEEPVVFPSLK